MASEAPRPWRLGTHLVTRNPLPKANFWHHLSRPEHPVLRCTRGPRERIPPPAFSASLIPTLLFPSNRFRSSHRSGSPEFGFARHVQGNRTGSVRTVFLK